MKTSVFSGEEEVSYFVFDSTTSNRLDWFSQSNVIESSYTDTDTSSIPRFSMNGYRPYIYFPYCNMTKKSTKIRPIDNLYSDITEKMVIVPFPRFYYLCR